MAVLQSPRPIHATSSPPKLLNLPLSQISQMRLPYVPKSPATDNLIHHLRTTYGVGKTIAFQHWEAADKSLSSDKNSSERFPLAYFTNVESDATTMPENLSVSMGIYRDTETEYVTPLNILIATAFINYHRTRDGLQPLTFEIFGQLFPTPDGTIKGLYKLIVMLKCVPAVFYFGQLILAMLIATERELKIKEVIKLMGVSTGIYRLSWHLTGSIFSLPVVAMITTSTHIGSNNHFVFYMWIQMFYINLMSLTYLVTSVCRTVFFVFLTLCSVMLLLPAAALLIMKLRITNWFLVLLLNTLLYPHAFYLGVEPFVSMSQEDGYDFKNLMTKVDKDGGNGFSLFDSILGMILNTLFYIFLTWYIENIFPGQYGIPQPYNFFLKPSYWTSKPMSTEEESIEQLPQDELYFEKEPEGLKVGVQAQNLVKVFGETVAVTGVNIKVYKNQITVLLGHNGAGKTTTLDMMAGVLPPSKGRLLINGYDMRNQSSQAHRCIGLCPQNDILYDQLTCTEHLVFYLWLRGLDTKDTCDDLLIKMGLESVVDNMAFELSRGEKRMLSLAIALSGSQVVILDEPSSGLDPSAQRGMWEVLQSIREDRTLLMTTHYMDEAEVLGDRIAIMADGVVKCCGSLQFLKHLYGTGYQLNIVTMPDCKPDKVTAFLQKILPGTQYLDKSHTELYFSLLEEDLNLFSKLFAQLEQNLQELGISSFDIKATTVEEVFMKVGDGIEPKANRLRMTANSAEHKDDHRESNVSADAVKVPDPGEMCSNQRYADESGTKKANKLLDYNEGYMPNKGRKRKLQQLKAMFIRRILLTKRQWKLTFYCVVFYPIVGLFIGILADTEIYQNIKRTIQPVELKPFGKKSSVYVWGHPGVNDQLVETYMDIFSGTSDKAERITETMNVTEYYLDKAENITLKDYPFTFLTAAEFLLVNDSNVRANALYGSTKHGDIVSVKLLLEALIKYYVANETSEFSCEMTFQTQAAKFYTVTLLFSTFTMVQISLIFFIQLGEEKQTGAKHLQQICGIDPFTFWLPSFCSHLSIYVFPVTMILMGMWYGAPESFIYGGRVRVLLLALILHGFAIMPFTYFATYFAEMLFKSLAVCAVAMFWFSSMGVILPLVEFHMRYNEKTKDDDHDEGITLLDVVGVVGVMLSLLSPTYNLLVVLLTMQSADAFHGDEADMVLGESDAQKAMTKMAAQCFCYFLLVFAVDFKLFRRIRYSLPSADVEHLKATSKIQSTEPVDDDVIAEERRIQNTPVQELCKENPLIMKGVSKVYGGKLLAVDDLYLSVAHNECFGLLGHNGAGKTAAFKMLTGNMTISQGDIYFLCQDIKTSLNSIVKHIGYCPQRNALDKSLTGRETLYLYGRLRGVPEENLDHVTRQLMKHLDITPHADKLTCNYSGGTKRKLCVGISLIGNPHLILLDEPTSGVDPAARRLIWDIFRDIRSAGKTIVMTSHSMEECEAVCTRLAIMVTGRFRCIGSLQHLKKKFGEGLSISVKMPSFLETEQERDSFLDFVKQSFPNSVITVNTTHYVRFLVLGKDIKWSTVFQTMETAKEEFSLSTYSVQQMTLEQIFLRFVKSANPPVRGKLSCKQQCLNCCE